MPTDLQRLHHDSSDRPARSAEERPDLAPPVDALHHPLQVLRVVVGGVLKPFARQRNGFEIDRGSTGKGKLTTHVDRGDWATNALLFLWRICCAVEINIDKTTPHAEAA